jgi:hypothetical protein
MERRTENNSGESNWNALSPELWDRIAGILEPNDVSCTLKLLNKATVANFKGCTTVRLSQSVPQHAYVWRWGGPDSTRGMTLKQRRLLVILTARSGVLANLQVAIAAADCTLVEDVFTAAVASGSQDMCQWLLDRPCKFCSSEAVKAAAGAKHLDLTRWLLQEEQVSKDMMLPVNAFIAAASAGHRDVCEGLLADGVPVHEHAVAGALREGHLALAEWLLERCPPQLVFDSADCRTRVLEAAATGLDLPSLQHIWLSVFGDSPLTGTSCGWKALLDAAVCSPTADWRDKVTWLEEQGAAAGAGHSVFNLAELMSRSDGVQRLQLVLSGCWREKLREQLEAVTKAIYFYENIPAGLLLLREGLFERPPGEFARMAGAEGDLAFLLELRSVDGWAVAAEDAACEGHLHVLQFLASPEAGREGQEALQQARPWLTYMAAASGSVEVMRWVLTQGCPWADRTFERAASSGNVVLLEMLAAEGCPHQV